MTGEFDVRYTDEARSDLLRLFEYQLDRARTAEDIDAAQSAIDAVTAAVAGHLSRTPFIYRKVGESPFLRELLVPFRASGYVVLDEIDDRSTVSVMAVRHQLEDDYY